MRFPTDVPVKLVMLGTGGTGGHAAPHLYRMLHALNRPARFILCDGDLVEAKNLIRQNFAPADLGQNKARVLAERYASVFGMKAEYVPSFVETREELMRLIRPGIWEIKEGPYLYKLKREMVLLLGCVDNNKSRRLCHEAFCQSQDLVYIDSGNEEFSGQVVCGVRRNGRTIFKPVGGIAPEILKAQDRFPSEISCAEAAQADPQSMAANIMAATVMVDMVYNISTGKTGAWRSCAWNSKMKVIRRRPDGSARKQRLYAGLLHPVVPGTGFAHCGGEKGRWGDILSAD